MKDFLKKRGSALPAIAVFLAAVLMGAAAQAHLMAAPTRVVFEERTRSATVLLMNTSSETQNYRMGWKFMKMNENGEYEDIAEDPGDPYSMSKMVVFSPRAARIDSNGRQNIRLSLRRPKDLPPGEYRGHLVMESIPDKSRKPPEPEVGKDGQKGVVFSLRVGFSMSIPVIVRNGHKAPFDLRLENAQILPPVEDDANQRQRMKIDVVHAVGANSSFGRIEVIEQHAGKEETLGMRNGVAVYPEMAKRIVEIPLKRPPAAGARLQIVYNGTEEYSGKKLAEKVITVSP